MQQQKSRQELNTDADKRLSWKQITDTDKKFIINTWIKYILLTGHETYIHLPEGSLPECDEYPNGRVPQCD